MMIMIRMIIMMIIMMMIIILMIIVVVVVVILIIKTIITIKRTPPGLPPRRSGLWRRRGLRAEAGGALEEKEEKLGGQYGAALPQTPKEPGRRTSLPSVEVPTRFKYDYTSPGSPRTVAAGSLRPSPLRSGGVSGMQSGMQSGTVGEQYTVEPQTPPCSEGVSGKQLCSGGSAPRYAAPHTPPQGSSGGGGQHGVELQQTPRSVGTSGGTRLLLPFGELPALSVSSLREELTGGSRGLSHYARLAGENGQEDARRSSQTEGSTRNPQMQMLDLLQLFHS
ncbi:hypothetical protein T492DRAFT_1114392 [Pavlovales sp. CCMP2436]|nr:hypothetical protein T492DRAFT_1114392 [Pavlovales sp. CCMP2436]